MPEDIVRVLRILEYVGPRSAVEKTLSNNAVKGTQTFGSVRVNSVIIGDFPEILTRANDAG